MSRAMLPKKSETLATPAAKVQRVLSSPGRPLDGESRRFFEPRFRYDFGQVRMHTGTAAAEAAESVNAAAFTVGRDLVFNEGQYEPSSSNGCRLIAHELTHTIQQSGGNALSSEYRLETEARTA